MQWLISQMWILLAVAGLLGLILGLTLRGLMGGNKLRRATVERDVARTELGQSRAEIDALYASQRKMKEGALSHTASTDSGESDRLRADLGMRDQRIVELETALQSTRDDLEVARSEQTEDADSGDALETAGAAIAGAAAGAVLGGDDDKVRELEERNTWLEERVKALETDIETLGTAPAVVASVEEVEAPASPNTTKLEWQNTYLRQRVEALEGQMYVAPVLAVDNEKEAVEPEVEEVAAVEASPQQDEEMARLRWRNRYLEGRLAYYEEDASEDEASASESEEVAAEEVEEVTEAASTDDEQDDVGKDEETADSSEAEIEVAEPEVLEEAAEIESEEHPADAVLRTLGDDPVEDTGDADETEIPSVQPEAFDRPKGGGDDLTAIGGIGPRIAEVLNGLGIWTYEQIAGWSSENAAWVEEHLSFKGRVEREDWINQAKTLIEQTSSD